MEKGFDDLSPGGFRLMRGSRLGKIVSTTSNGMSCKLMEREGKRRRESALSDLVFDKGEAKIVYRLTA